MIQEDYVSFETAKLLKEKGFTGNGIHKYYDISNENHILYSESYIHEFDKDFWMGNLIMAPTLEMSMKWLREIHNIQITIAPIRKGIYSYGISRDFSPLTIKIENFMTYEQACEAAITYCLTKLL